MVVLGLGLIVLRKDKEEYEPIQQEEVADHVLDVKAVFVFAFVSSKYPQSPLTLLRYHVVPLKLENGDLSSVTYGTKIDTLLLGHPLVVTTLQSD
ncbi:hypothetical protein FEM48_Zijuj01G0242700 [Ziziphus jujuba var. spinosa]|uniref:Uncharacterized protein n=1 Tax=Ziziphus jujuba var. spinosa TaxID=714518 RepID=A0A978W4E7_ZIZJJ|nr:hypothetical protein FEM48_Zijuj01G0242700 [Ziziphus jujuba var. spinosa]